MGDPFSIATGVITLLTTTWTVGTELKKFRDGVLVIDKTIRDLEHDINALASVLASMRDTFETITAENGASGLVTHWTNVAQAINDGNGLVGEIRDELQEVNKTTKFMDQSRKQLRLNLAGDKLSGLRERVHSLRETLQLSLQVITVTNQVSHQGALVDLCQEIRRLAKKMNETIESQHAVAQSSSDEAQITAMVNLRECVRSAASIVSSASTAIMSQDGDNDRQTVTMSDFGDCFPLQHNLAMSRWIVAPSIQEYEQDRSIPPPQSVVDLFSLSDGAGSSDSEVDLEDEITTALLEDGQQKLLAGNLKDAERVLKKCSERLSNVTWEQRGGHASKQFSKHVQVLQNLFVIYRQQGMWLEAQTVLAQKLNVGERMSRKKDVNYLWDVVELAKILQWRGEATQALLEARRALKGFKKLQNKNDIRACLELLIALCNTNKAADDEEVYTLMLSRMETNVAAPTESVSLTTTVPKPDPTNSTIVMPGKDQEGTENTKHKDQADLSRELNYAPRNHVHQREASFDAMQRSREMNGDLAPFEVRPNEKTCHKETQFHEDLSLDQEEEVTARDAQGTGLGIASRSVAVRKEQPGVDELDEIVSVHRWAISAMDNMMTNGQQDLPETDLSFRFNVEVDVPSTRSTKLPVGDDDHPTVDDHSQNNLATRTQRDSTPERRIGMARSLEYDSFTDRTRVSLDRTIAPICDVVDAGSPDIPRDDCDHTLADEDAVVLSSIAEQAQLGKIDRSSHEADRRTDGRYMLYQTPETDHHSFWSPANSSKSKSSFDSSPNLATLSSMFTSSEVLTPASTNTTVPSGSSCRGDQPETSPDPRRVWEASTGKSIDHRSSHDTPSKPSRQPYWRRKARNWSTRRSWTHEEADYEKSLTSSDPPTPYQNLSGESRGKALHGANKSVSMPGSSEMGSEQLIGNTDVQAVGETSLDSESFILTTLPELNSNNIAEASGEPTASAALSIDQTSVVSLVGTDAQTSVEELRRNEHMGPESLKQKVAYIALIGDGLCGKTSLMQHMGGKPFSSYWDVGFHHVTVQTEMDGQNVEVVIYDAPGQEGHIMIDKYARNADCILLCFAIDFPISLENIMDKWIHQVPNRGKTPIILVGCKSDLRLHPDTMNIYRGMAQRILSPDECKTTRTNIGAIKYLECSAKIGQGVDAVMATAARAALLHKMNPTQKRRSKLFSLLK